MLFLQRWGDAPVHSIGAALFAKKDQIVSFFFFWKYLLNSKFTNFNSTSSMISVTVTNRFNTAPKVILVTSVGVIPTITSVSRVY